VIRRHCKERSDEAIHSFFARRDGLLRGGCHRARIRATRWLAMTTQQPVGPLATTPKVRPRRMGPAPVRNCALGGDDIEIGHWRTVSADVLICRHGKSNPGIGLR
jgi:hypothetical protein